MFSQKFITLLKKKKVKIEITRAEPIRAIRAFVHCGISIVGPLMPDIAGFNCTKSMRGLQMLIPTNNRIDIMHHRAAAATTTTAATLIKSENDGLPATLFP